MTTFKTPESMGNTLPERRRLQLRRLCRQTVAAVLVFGGGSLALGGIPSLSGAEKAVAAQPRADVGISETPAYEALKALDLLQVAPRDGLTVEGTTQLAKSAYVTRIKLNTAPGTDPMAARGLDILRFELVNVNAFDLRAFDLLYNGEGKLIAIVPAFAGESAGGPARTAEVWKRISPAYFDMSPYYVPIQILRERKESGRWKEFAQSFQSDQALIDAFLEERFSFLRAIFPEFFGAVHPYRLHELDTSTGDWFAYGFSLEAFLEEADQHGIVSTIDPLSLRRRMFSGEQGKARLVIPKFPTVYVVPTFTPDELEYMRGVFKKFKLGPDSKILVVGPGTGVDTWVASFRTEQPVHVIGINPLEVANTEATARIAGFKVRAVVGNNIIDDNGRSRFPEELFDAVFWSMPSYKAEKRDVPFAFEEFWDGDVGGVILKRFARGLPKVLKPGGKAFLWNFASDRDGRNEVAEILKRAETPNEVFTIEEERFARRVLRPGQKGKEFLGLLYTVSFAKPRPDDAGQP